MQDKKVEAIESIIEAAKNNNEISKFGHNVAEILIRKGLINKEVYDILAGK